MKIYWIATVVFFILVGFFMLRATKIQKKHKIERVKQFTAPIFQQKYLLGKDTVRVTEIDKDSLGKYSLTYFIFRGNDSLKVDSIFSSEPPLELFR